MKVVGRLEQAAQDGNLVEAEEAFKELSYEVFDVGSELSTLQVE